MCTLEQPSLLSLSLISLGEEDVNAFVWLCVSVCIFGKENLEREKMWKGQDRLACFWQFLLFGGRLVFSKKKNYTLVF